MLVATKEFSSAVVTINQDVELLKPLELYEFQTLAMGVLTDASLSVRWSAEVLETGAFLFGQQRC